MPNTPTFYNTDSALLFNNNLLPTFGAPLDVRCVLKTKNDLVDSTFLSYHPYVGMIVVIVSDSNSDNNGVWYKFAQAQELSSWKKVGEASSFNWPPDPSPIQPGATYILEWNNGDPQWIVLPTPEPGTSFTFNINQPYIENSEGYSIGDQMSSSTDMSLSNQYNFDNQVHTADVVAVKDSAKNFHLMLNPDIKYILFGGDSEGLLMVTLTVVSPIELGKSEYNISQENPVGIQWFVNSHLYSTDPDNADLYFYETEEDALLDHNQTTKTHHIDITDPDYNNLYNEGDYLELWCIASKSGYLDSLIRKITITITDDFVTVTVEINEVTRTTANGEIE